MEDIKVEETIDDNGSPRLIFTTPKFKAKFIVRKSNDGFSFFEVAVDSGRIPAELGGKYTGLSQASQEVKKYIKKSKETKSVKRDRTYEKNHGSTVSTASD
jgi:hypothetical protein